LLTDIPDFVTEENKIVQESVFTADVRKLP